MITPVSFFVCLLCVALVNAKSNRIVGGSIAHPDQFKYQIALKDKNDIICGGAIIADQFVLTAAHCVVDSDGRFHLSKFYVVAGSTNAHTKQGVRIDVEKIYVPSRYNANDQSNDIAVLKLRRELGLGSNPNLEKIELPPNKESSYVGHTAVVSGYGFNYVAVRYNRYLRREEEYDGRSDGKLGYAMTNVISNEECIRKNEDNMINKNQICAQAVQREGQPTGVCRGDSGGPLVSDNIIIGINSFGPTGCVEDKYSGVYTRVSSFIGFIVKAMKDAKASDLVVREIPIRESSSSSSDSSGSIGSSDSSDSNGCSDSKRHGKKPV